MKKGLCILAGSMLLTVAAAAAPENPTNKSEQGEPKKEKEQKSSFGLTDGYFSIFEIFKEVGKVDSIKPNVVLPSSKGSATYKK